MHAGLAVLVWTAHAHSYLPRNLRKNDFVPSSFYEVEALMEEPKCGDTLPLPEDPDYWNKLLEMEQCGCGKVCSTDNAGTPGTYFNFVRKPVNCEVLFERSQVLGKITNRPPPKELPDVMKQHFEMEDQRINIRGSESSFHDESATQGHAQFHWNWTHELMGELIHYAETDQLLERHHGGGDPYKMAVKIRKFLNTTHLKDVTTIEYAKIISGEPRLTIMHPDQYKELYKNPDKYFDCIVSYSSLEHAGLGRYGDLLDPWGDLRAMAQLQCITKPHAAFFVGLETEKDGTIDEIVWNSHRVYGPKRLPQFFANIKVTDSIPPAQFFFGRKVD